MNNQPTAAPTSAQPKPAKLPSFKQFLIQIIASTILTLIACYLLGGNVASNLASGETEYYSRVANSVVNFFILWFVGGVLSMLSIGNVVFMCISGFAKKNPAFIAVCMILVIMNISVAIPWGILQISIHAPQLFIAIPIVYIIAVALAIGRFMQLSHQSNTNS